MSEDLKKYMNLFEDTKTVSYQPIGEDHDLPASPQEAEMAGDQAEFIKYAIEEIKDSIMAGNDFPEWFQNKLSGVHNTMKTLHAWMEGDKRNVSEDFDDEPLKYAGKFQVGDVIRGYDFRPAPEKNKDEYPDRYIQGKVIDTKEMRQGAAMYVIEIDNDSGKTSGGRVGDIGYIPHETLFDFDGRVVKVDNTNESKDVISEDVDADTRYYNDLVSRENLYHTGADLASPYDGESDEGENKTYHDDKESNHLEAGALAFAIANYHREQGDNAGYTHWSRLGKAHDDIAEKHMEKAQGYSDAEEQRKADEYNAKHGERIARNMDALNKLNIKKESIKESKEFDLDDLNNAIDNL